MFVATKIDQGKMGRLTLRTTLKKRKMKTKTDLKGRLEKHELGSGKQISNEGSKTNLSNFFQG